MRTEFLSRAFLRGKPPDAAAVEARRSRVLVTSRLRSRRPRRSYGASDRAALRVAPESSDRAAASRGSADIRRPRLGTRSPETHPTWARTGRRRPALRRPTWPASVRSEVLQKAPSHAPQWLPTM